MSPSARSIRPPAVAGLFYPEDPAALRDAVTGHLEAAGAVLGGRPETAPPKAVIAPHAGYSHSGPTAGIAFRALLPDPESSPVRRAVVIGPAHRVPFRGIAISGADAFATPLGEVPVDRELSAAVEKLPSVFEHPAAHAPEHSLEVELPFLQELLPELAVLPLVVGDAAPSEVAEVLDAVWGGAETAIVVSSDLSHYLPYERAREVDRETAERILALGGPIEGFRACGARPIGGLLLAARSRGFAPSLLDLRSSGDTADDRESVVGYGAFAFAEP